MPEPQTYHGATTALLSNPTIPLNIFYCNLVGHLLLVLVFIGKIWKQAYLSTCGSTEICYCTPQTPIEERACIAEHLVDILHSIYFNTFNVKDYFQCHFTYFVYDHKHSSAFGKRMSRQYGICFLIGITKSCIEVEPTLRHLPT